MSESVVTRGVLGAEALAIGHEKKVVVPNLSFSLEAGQSLALVGGNGSGKTTLLRTIAGLLPPLGGTIQVLGTSPGRAARRLAWLGQFQTTNPLLPLRARDVVRMAFFPDRGLWGRLTAGDETLVEEALAFFGADRFAKKPISELSGGQRQRVYLAYVLARRADLVLLDEPLSNLDGGGMDLYGQAIDRWKASGTSVVVATHNLEDAAACDRALVFGPEGWAFGPGNEVLQGLPHHH
jgi:ABC-type Mn2+/Zn2+ transport system ATPase subunit